MDETAIGFQTRAHLHFNQLLADKDKQLERAGRALRLEAAKLKQEREKAKLAVEALLEIREDYRGSASQGHYVAILALIRVTDILGYSDLIRRNHEHRTNRTPNGHGNR